MSLTEIELDPLPEYPEIILALSFIRSAELSFHWTFFVPNRGATSQVVSAGTKMHVIQHEIQDNFVAKWWDYESSQFTLATSRTLTAAAVLGRLPPGKTAEDLNGLLAKIPYVIPTVDAQRERTFTCRVWAREAVRQMHNHGYIHCTNVDALEEEMWKYGSKAVKTQMQVRQRVALRRARSPCRCRAFRRHSVTNDRRRRSVGPLVAAGGVG